MVAGGRLEPGLTSSLTESQARAVVGVSQACLLSPLQPRLLCLLQTSGEAETVKCLAALVLQISLSSSSSSSSSSSNQPDSRQRVLVVSPSGGCLDQLTLRLISAQAELPPSLRLRLLRFGPAASADSEVVKVSLEAVVAAHRDQEIRRRTASASVEADLASKARAVGKVRDDLRAAQLAGQEDLAAKLRRDEAQLSLNINKLERLRRLGPESGLLQEVESLATERTLREADVMLSSLASLSSLSSALASSPRPVSVCVLVGAGSCPEPDCLLPLSLGVRKLVLVGSESDTVTVTSQTARNLNYGQSLFSRLASIYPPLRIDQEQDRDNFSNK